MPIYVAFDEPVVIPTTYRASNSAEARRLTTPLTYTCWYTDYSSPGTCDNRLDPGTSNSAMFEWNTTMTYETYFDNTGGSQGAPVVDAFGPTIFFEWFNAGFEPLSHEFPVDGGQWSCQETRTSDDYSLQCFGGSIPQGGAAVLVTRVSTGSSNGTENQIFTEVGASNSIAGTSNVNFVVVVNPRPQLGTLTGFIYEDLLGDRNMNTTDPGVPSWGLVYDVDLNGAVGSGDLTFTTGATGAYTYANVAAGNYQLLLQNTSTTYVPYNGQYSYTGTVTANQQLRFDVPMYRPSTFGGCVYDDGNNNGSREAGEAGLSGVTVQWTHRSVTNSVLTGLDGCYAFGSREPGNYVVTVTQTGRTATEPSTGFSRTFQVASGSSQSSFDFGSYVPGIISGRKVRDDNGNGVADSNEAGLPGWTITLDGGATTTTGLDGTYSFTGVVPGTHTVVETAQQSWLPGAAASQTVTVASGETKTVNFANYQVTILTGVAWADDFDGVFGAGELGLEGWTVTRTLGGTTTTATTGSDGRYTFGPTIPGVSTVTIETRLGFTLVFPTSGSHEVTLQSGETSADQNFGIGQAGSISGQKIHDLNGNGVADQGEPGLPEWVMTLTGGGTATTGSDGSYSFTGLVPGSHTVTETVQDGWTASTAVSQTVTVAAGAATSVNFLNYQPVTIQGLAWQDNNADGVQGTGEPLLEGWTVTLTGASSTATTTTAADGTYSFTGLLPGAYTVTLEARTGWTLRFPTSGLHETTLQSGQTASDLNFGIEAPPETGTVTGRKINDLNGNGQLDAGEPGLPDWTISITDLATAVTGSDGSYSLTGLEPGTYTVTETAQAGWITSTSNGASRTVTVVAGETVGNIDFYNYQPPTITGRKWQDDGDGELETGELFVPGWPISLAGPGGTTTETITDSNGRYTFSTLVAGATYIITEGTREGWTQRFPTSGSHEVIPQGGQTVIGRNFGNEPPPIPPGSIHGIKFLDLTPDSQKGDQEPGVDGVMIRLLDAGETLVTQQLTHNMDLNDDGWIDPTTEMGLFWFEELSPGTYFVEEVVPDGLSSPLQRQTVTVFPNQAQRNILFPNRPDATNLDWGDLPDQRGDLPGACPAGIPLCYATLNASWGPSHVITAQPFVLGQIIDGEGDGQPNDIAHLDDDTAGAPVIDYGGGPAGGFKDDEDGLVSISVQPDGSIQMEVIMTHPTGGGAKLDVWIDLNDDGFLADGRDPTTLTTERMFNAEPLVNGVNIISTNPLNLSLLPGERVGFIRMRLSSVGGLWPYGPALDGEVEDHYDIAVDFGDAPANEDPDHPEIPFGYPTKLAQNGARHTAVESIRIGDRIDAEGDGKSSIFADGDDLDNQDDEDGIVFGPGFLDLRIALDGDPDDLTNVPGIVPGVTAKIAVFPSTTGDLDAWFDWNRDGDWDDDGEWVIRAEDVSPMVDTVEVAIPADATPGFTFARFRFSANGTSGPAGFHNRGEVEDYLVRTVRETSVRSASDNGDSNPGDGICDDGTGQCTLRAAIQEANASGAPIVLTFATFNKRAAVVLTPQSPLPPFTAPITLLGGGQLQIDGSQAGSGAHGLQIEASGSSILGTAVYNFDGDGIRITGNNNLADEDSLVANGGAGIRVVSGTGNRIRRMSIEANGALGIDLGEDGKTANDSGDADTGPNGLMNTPVLALATAENGHIEGTLDGAPNGAFEIDFYSSPVCDVSGAGQGRLFLGTVTASTDGVGTASITADFASGILGIGDAVTATATDAQGNTSEFSGCFTAVSTLIERLPEEIPTGFNLSQNYPNPFNPVTTIQFAVPARVFVRIDVFDIQGKHLARLVNTFVEKGEFEVTYDASALPSGIYLYRMTAGSFTESREFTLLK